MDSASPEGQPPGTPRRGSAANLEFSPYDYEIQEDPYPVYARLRDEAPLYRNDGLDFWALSRHADVAAAFRDSERFSNANGVSLDPSAWGPRATRTMSFLAMDPPKHDRMRALVSRGFTPRRVQDLEERISSLARKHLDACLSQDSFDFVAEFAGKLPMDVVSELLGVPEPDREQLRLHADTLLHREDGAMAVPRASSEAAFSLIVYFIEMVEERRARPASQQQTPDLTSALLEAETDGDRLTDEEIVGFLFLMIVAGNETTTKLLASALYWAWRNPDQLAMPMSDPAFIGPWIEETIRYDSPSQMLARTVTKDFASHGQTVRAGDRLVLVVGAANRDPAVFPDPDRYDLERDTSSLISFGSGRHYCLGANLARLEAKVALGEFTRRVARFEIDESRAERVHSPNVRGFSTLPVQVEVR
jgi:cytochrome P450